MNLTIIKTRKKGAETGHSLLCVPFRSVLSMFVPSSQCHSTVFNSKKKADALTKRFRVITGKIDEVCFHSGFLSVYMLTLNAFVSPGQTQNGSHYAAGRLLSGGSDLLCW